ncbi:uncharacterized protein LOC134215284 [Armigeres subalbatus]|uniref:uncharacterized protein LOC134215284 n=1 Tax=Armigeres subalbatus TaxID=124917 RepID=UPI002ED27B7C
MLSDFVKVTSRYLKATAVPSKKISRIIKLPRRDLKKLNLPIHLEDHNYSEYACPPRSNRICYVEECRSKTEGDIKLHKFPGRKDVRFKEWIRVLKCGSRLKRDAIPSLNFSNTTTGSDSTSSSEVSPTHGSTYCHEEDQAKKNTSSDRISENQSTHVPVFVVDSCEDHNDGEIGGNRSNDFAVGQSFQESQILNDTLLLDTSQLSINTPIAESTAKKPPAEKDSLQNSVKASFLENSYNKSAISNSQVSKAKSENFILSDLLLTDKEVNIWTGVPTLVLLEEICLACRKLETSFYCRQFSMHTTNRVILTLAKLKQNLSFEALGILFRISGVTVSNYFSHMVQILRRVLKPFVYWPAKEEILKNIPLCFREHFPNVTIVLDCTEVPVATPKCLNCRISCYSNYKGRRTIKFLIGVTPAGLISFISNAYTGKSSDKYIFNQEQIINRLEAHRDEVMVDKGVSIQHECLTNHIKLHIPPFMRSERLSPLEASNNEAIAKARIHVERVIQRIKIFNVLTDCVTPPILGHIDDITIIVCGIVNLTAPILADNKF